MSEGVLSGLAVSGGILIGCTALKILMYKLMFMAGKSVYKKKNISLGNRQSSAVENALYQEFLQGKAKHVMYHKGTDKLLSDSVSELSKIIEKIDQIDKEINACGSYENFKKKEKQISDKYHNINKMLDVFIRKMKKLHPNEKAEIVDNSSNIVDNIKRLADIFGSLTLWIRCDNSSDAPMKITWLANEEDTDVHIDICATMDIVGPSLQKTIGLFDPLLKDIEFRISDKQSKK